MCVYKCRSIYVPDAFFEKKPHTDNTTICLLFVLCFLLHLLQSMQNESEFIPECGCHLRRKEEILVILFLF